METARAVTDLPESRFDGLHAEAKAAIAVAANALRVIRERYRQAYLDELAEWHAVRDEVDRGGQLTATLGEHQAELARLELAQQSLDRMSRFVDRADTSLAWNAADPSLSSDVRMRIVEAQELERSRMAQEMHDGPAQALANAIFQVEYLERTLEREGRFSAAELRFLRELLRRELGDVRAIISHLRPPLLDEVGLDQAIRDAVDSQAAVTGLPISVELAAPAAALDATQQVVVLRIVGEALQNVRKHAAASRARVVTGREVGSWWVEVSDDGRGFDPAAVASSGRQNFGLRFMRERADLIGAECDVRSRPGGGTVVRLTIPIGGESTR